MNKNVLIIIAILFISTNALSQSWTYNEGGDAFDGKYRTSSIDGIGTDYPYHEPMFVVNYFENSNNLNVYISNAGYAGCDGKVIKVKFNNNDTIYTFDATTNSDRDIWFLKEYANEFYDYNTLTLDQLLKKLMKYSKFFVRVSSDCGKNDLEFSLNGSSKAINFVLPDNYFAIKKQKKIEARKRKEEEAKYDELIDKGDDFADQKKYDSAISHYRVASELMPDKMEPLNKIEKIKKIKERQKKIEKMKEENKYLVVMGTNLYPNPDGTGDAIVHVSSKTFVKILDESKGEGDYIYVLYKGHKGYIHKMSLKDK